MKPTYRKSWAGSLDVIRFDLGLLLQSQMRIGILNSAYNLLIIGLRGLQCHAKPSQPHGLEIF